MFEDLIIYTLGGSLVLWAADLLIPDVYFNGSIQVLFLAGFVLGFINSIIRPIIKKITWPLRIITLGLFNFVINMAILEFVDTAFPELVINGLWPLFLTSLLVSITSGFFHKNLWIEY